MLAVDINCAGGGIGELHRLGNDGVEHGFEIEGRIDRLRHIAERSQFADRAAEIVGRIRDLLKKDRRGRIGWRSTR